MRWGQPRGGPGAPCRVRTFPPCFVEEEERALHPPERPLVPRPPAQPQEGLAVQPGSRLPRCSSGTVRRAQEHRRSVAGAGRRQGCTQLPRPPAPAHGARGLCGAAPRPPLNERGVSASFGSCGPRRAPRAPSPPNSSAGRPAPAAVGALLFSDVTLEHKQLCSSSPSPLITLCLTRRIRRKGLNFESASAVPAHRREKQLYPFKTGVIFHTGSNPSANLLSLPSPLSAPHAGRAGRAGRMLPASGSFLPYPAS